MSEDTNEEGLEDPGLPIILTVVLRSDLTSSTNYTIPIEQVVNVLRQIADNMEAEHLQDLADPAPLDDPERFEGKECYEKTCVLRGTHGWHRNRAGEEWLG